LALRPRQGSRDGDASSCVAVASGADEAGARGLEDEDEVATSSLCCRFCLDGANGAGDPLVAPCRCRGTARYVHESCLSRWRCVGRSEASFSACLECRAPYRLRLRRAASSPLGLWRARALDVLLRDFIVCYVLFQALLVGLACALAAADPRRQAYHALGRFTCRATALIAPPPRSMGGLDDSGARDDDDVFDERAHIASTEEVIAALRRACTREFYFVAAFVVVVAASAACSAAAALARLCASLFVPRDDADHDGFAAQKQASPAELLVPRCAVMAPRDLFVCASLVLTAFLLAGFPGAILAGTAAALRAMQLRALALQRWRLVQTYAAVDGAYPATTDDDASERPHCLPEAHRDYLHALGFLPAAGA